MNSKKALRKFGHPSATIRLFHHWALILKYKQWTLGCMILLCTEDAHELWDVSIDTLKELPIILRFIDERLRPKLAYHRLNYFRMGNVDPEMHFHLMPRYEGERTLCGITIPDRGWPKGPDLTVTLLDEAAHARLLKTLRITLA